MEEQHDSWELPREAERARVQMTAIICGKD